MGGSMGLHWALLYGVLTSDGPVFCQVAPISLYRHGPFEEVY